MESGNQIWKDRDGLLKLLDRIDIITTDHAHTIEKAETLFNLCREPYGAAFLIYMLNYIEGLSLWEDSWKDVS
jgi:hypothetical protein